MCNTLKFVYLENKVKVSTFDQRTIKCNKAFANCLEQPSRLKGHLRMTFTEKYTFQEQHNSLLFPLKMHN